MHYNVELKPLDWILYPVNSFIGHPIRWFTGDKVHAAKFFTMSGRNLQFDARWPYADVNPLSAELIKSKPGVAVRRFPKVDEMDGKELAALNEKMIGLVMLLWGQLAYDVGGLLAFPYRRLIKSRTGREARSLPADAFCSCLGAVIDVKLLGLDPVPDWSDNVTSPWDVYESDELVTVTEDLRLI